MVIIPLIVKTLLRKSAPVAWFMMFAAVLFTGLMWQRHGRREGAVFAMGGIPVRVVAYDRTRTEFNHDVQAVASEVDRLEDVFSRYRTSGEVGRLNAGGKGCFDVSPTLAQLMMQAAHWHTKSRGAFDVTVVPLIELWKAAERSSTLPDERTLATARARVGMGKVRVTDGQVCFARDRMAIDLGAIAKGAILDTAAQTLVQRGVARGLVDAGGDVAAFGEGSFTIGVRDPLSRDPQALMGALNVPAGGVVTSGGYERFVTIAGERFSHIIDPRTGMPAAALDQVTVVGPTATDADALATAIAVMGREQGIALMSQLDGFEAIMVENGQVWCSRSICERFNLAPRWQQSQFSY